MREVVSTAFELEKEPDSKLKAYLNKYIDQRIIEASRQLYDAVNEKLKTVEERIQEVELKTRQNRAAIIASKGALDMAYPPLPPATGARSIGIEASIFFTLNGLNKTARLFYCEVVADNLKMDITKALRETRNF